MSARTFAAVGLSCLVFLTLARGQEIPGDVILDARPAARDLSPNVLRGMRASRIPIEDLVVDPPRSNGREPVADAVSAGSGVAAEVAIPDERAADDSPTWSSTGTGDVADVSAGSGEGAAEPAPTIDLAALRKLDGVGAVELHQAGRTVAMPGSDALTLSEGQVLAVRAPSAAPILSTVDGVAQAASPTRLFTLDTAGEVRQFSLVHRVQPLTWIHADNHFAGTLLVALVDSNRPFETVQLPSPIPVQFLAPGARFTPRELAIDTVGGRFEPVEVVTSDPVEPFAVQLMSPVDRDVPAAQIPLHRIPLVIRAPARIDAFGIETAVVTVRSRYGRLPEGAVVTLDLDNGVLDAYDLTVDARGIAGTKMRSTRLGEGTLRVAGGPYDAAAVTVRYVPPLQFAIVMVVGAMLGAAVFVYALARDSRRPRRLIVDWLVGVIVGVGVTAMLYAGVKLPEWLPMPKVLVGLVVPFAVAFAAAAMAAAVIAFLTGVRAGKRAEKLAARAN